MLLMANFKSTICMPQQKSRYIRPGYIFHRLQLSSFSDPVPTAASAFCTWRTKVKHDVVFCCSAAFCRLVTELLQPSSQLKPICLFAVVISKQHLCISFCRTRYFCALFCKDLPSKFCLEILGEKQLQKCLSVSGTNNQATAKINKIIFFPF